MKGIACLAAALLLPATAVAQTQPAGGPSNQPGCRPGAAAVVGALLGALVGGASGGHNRGQRVVAGAAIGAAVGGIGCVAFNSNVTQQRSNAEVQRQYASRVRRATGPVLIKYETQPSAPAYPIGNEVQLRSHMVLAVPDTSAANSVSERYTITTPDGQTKTFDKTIAQSGGEMTNDLTFVLPKAMPKGVYRVDSQLLVADQVVGQTQSSFQVV